MNNWLALWFLLPLILSGCNLPHTSPTEIPPLDFPDLAPTYTPLPVFAADTPMPEIITATPVTPSPTPATVSLEKIAKWSQANAYEAL